MPRRRFDVGVISDTHGLVRDEALATLRGVDHVVHAGDVGDAKVLDALRALAPLTVVRGNNDVRAPLSTLPLVAEVTLAGVAFLVVHERDDVPARHAARVVVSGHSHRPSIEEMGGVLYVNPGSAGPRRFSLPVTLARIRLEKGQIHVEHLRLLDG